MTTKTKLRHLLEMAARACGIEYDEVGPYIEVPCMQSEYGKGTWVENVRKDWRPDIDDGQNSRMRSALKINVLWSDSAVHCLNSFGDAVESFANHNGNRDAALRLCALRVAAAIGRNAK